LQPQFVERLLELLGQAGMPSVAETLTEREREVLACLGRGLSNEDIAAELVISVGTAKRHIHHIFTKLEVGSRTQAIARARELGLI
jgi:ATP/maltotriose-dependent transcriptional regulator MalT